MTEDKCHISGCNKLADKKCQSCSNKFCAEHFDDGHPYQLLSSDISYDIVYSNCCHECWKKESNSSTGLFLVVIVSVLTLLLVLSIVVGLVSFPIK